MGSVSKPCHQAWLALWFAMVRLSPAIGVSKVIDCSWQCLTRSAIGSSHWWVNNS
ncbi:Uncharacterised protein [Vibrio cholerae]|uniref:Uncharacterized protein n=1 Tax=Vibrio cholerae TaxID=666 RepID=A0A656AT87_VIBCL|nr:Uncharacterised protein [Vibrio cholerae]